MTRRYTHAEIEHARAAFEIVGKQLGAALKKKSELVNVVEIRKRRKAG